MVRHPDPAPYLHTNRAQPVPFSPTIGRNATAPKIIAPAWTAKFIAKNDPVPETADTHSFPAGTHWVDWAEPGTVAVIEQPAGQYCAVLGGIMAVRMKTLGVQGAVVNGRVRDLAEINACQLPVCRGSLLSDVQKVFVWLMRN